jgi:glycosyltransferase involved in cell wall biosynthesis/2-polyprenyl-3-methyl-5-hydroxy-6-metoxy-1,4-benzoquinol methylase
MTELSVTYYGHLFDASGYGQAARAYIHALHRAGVRLSAVDLMSHGRQVGDELVESLVDRPLDPDFHVFHGIPPQWAGRAFPLRNAIAVTVWETDTMPPQWRNVLSHVLEVWLPCEFNVSVFRRDLTTPLFKWPHALVPARPNGQAHDDDAFLGTSPGDFVFYSAFEWQDRKGPELTIGSFLRAFPDEGDAVLVLKTNPGAAEVAGRALTSLRSQTGSRARVHLHPAGWSEEDMEALRRRGDCYVSLHRGEGWGYPLFQAASRGTPVIATAYSGPVEYLPPECPLVPYRLTPVQQPYLYYRPSMRWAEPDGDAAVERMRWIHGHREEARAHGVAVARRIHESYSLEAVGLQGRERLLSLLQRTRPPRWREIRRRQQAQRLKPCVPIPDSWFDADYFETGLKSNWNDGYSWSAFGGLFRKTADFLLSTFPDVESVLDVGCAKGFLVHALREKGRAAHGIDVSPWAIASAGPEVAAHLTRARAEEFAPERSVDLVVALDLLSQLTEEQALAFLTRIRPWTRGGLLATIASFETDDDLRRHAAQGLGHDLSHVTLQTRAYWHDLFLRAGWRQDPLHRLAQRACQEHSLPREMGWRIFLYSPGCAP